MRTRGIKVVRQDRGANDLPPGAPLSSAPSRAVVFGAPETVLPDLPQLTDRIAPLRRRMPCLGQARSRFSQVLRRVASTY
jgi:hypothetical protein